jgi:hypothetical protein
MATEEALTPIDACRPWANLDNEALLFARAQPFDDRDYIIKRPPPIICKRQIPAICPISQLRISRCQLTSVALSKD